MRYLGRRVFCGLFAAAAAPAAEPLRVGLLHTLSNAPLYIAQQETGLDVSFRFFEAAQPIAAATVAGDIDVGITALTGGFFSLAGKGALVVIGGALHEEPGFRGSALLVSRRAYESGLTTPDRLPGHSFAITQFGSSFHYMIGRIAEREKFDLKSITLRPLQQVANMVAAVRSGQVDATIAIASMANPVVAAGEGKIIAWIGDLVPYQITALFTSRRVIAADADRLHRFCTVYGKSVDLYRAAFLRTGSDGKPVHDAATAQAIAAIRHYVFTNDADADTKILEGVGYYDAGGALDTADVAAQLRWFLAQGLVKDEVRPEDIIDTGFLPVIKRP